VLELSFGNLQQTWLIPYALTGFLRVNSLSLDLEPDAKLKFLKTFINNWDNYCDVQTTQKNQKQAVLDV
jgi:hypothetical protein